jgi:hypothetical protein
VSAPRSAWVLAVALAGCAATPTSAPEPGLVEFVGEGPVTQWLRLDVSTPGQVGFRIEARQGGRALAHAEGTAWIAAAAASPVPGAEPTLLLEPYMYREGDCYVLVRLDIDAPPQAAVAFMEGCWDTSAIPWDSERVLRRKPR